MTQEQTIAAEIVTHLRALATDAERIALATLPHRKEIFWARADAMRDAAETVRRIYGLVM
jgi:surface antigen